MAFNSCRTLVFFKSSLSRFDGDSESEGDEDLDTEEVLQLPDSEEEDEGWVLFNLT